MTHKVKITPLHDLVVVRRLESETKSSGGIVLLDNTIEKPNQGEVLAIGPGKTLDNGAIKVLGVKAGDKIVFGKYAGSEIKIDDQEVIVMREDDIIGVLNEP